jgi:hypothetical protein
MESTRSASKEWIAFAIIALVLVPLSVRADGPPFRIALGHSTSDAQWPIWLPDSLEAIYQYDDGTVEGWVVPLLNGRDDQPEAIFLEQFEVIPGQNVIDSIAVAWGHPSGSGKKGLNGQPVTLGIWSDPDNDGQPYDAVLLGWVEGVVSSANTNTFVTYTFNHPVTIPDEGPNSFFLGFKTPARRHGFADNQGRVFAGVDLNSSAGKGWLIWNDPRPTVRIKHLGDNLVILSLGEPFFLPGNLMIRSGF